MDVPVNLKSRLNTFRTKVSSLKNDCQNLLSKYDSIRENIEGNALEEATLDLRTAFTINSLFWLYLTCKGLDPKNHDLRLEINRIKQANLRLKKLQEASKAPRVNVPAAKRFIRSALFDPDSEKSVKYEKTEDIEHGDDDDQRRKKVRLSEEAKDDIEMKSKAEDNQEEDSEENQDGEDDDEGEEEEEIEMDEEKEEETTAKINSKINYNQGNPDRSRRPRKIPNERSNRANRMKKRMLKMQMKKKPQQRPNRN